jgi:hypothetical protein
MCSSENGMCLLRQPDEHVRVLAHGPRHGDVLEGVVRFAKKKNGLVFQSVQVRHGER